MDLKTERMSPYFLFIAVDHTLLLKCHRTYKFNLKTPLGFFLFPTNAACCRPQRQKGHTEIPSPNSIGNTLWGKRFCLVFTLHHVAAGAMPVPLFQLLPRTHGHYSSSPVGFQNHASCGPPLQMLPNSKHRLVQAQSKRSELNIIMLGTLVQCWQTKHDIWEASSEDCFVLRHLVSVQSRTLSRGIQVLSISSVPDAFICITYITDELQFLGPINQCLTYMPLVMCSWPALLTTLPLSVHQYLCSAQPRCHFLFSAVVHDLIQPESFLV